MKTLRALNFEKIQSCLTHVGTEGWTNTVHEAYLLRRIGGITSAGWLGDAVNPEVDFQIEITQNLLAVDCRILEKRHGAKQDNTEAKVD